MGLNTAQVTWRLTDLDIRTAKTIAVEVLYFLILATLTIVALTIRFTDRLKKTVAVTSTLLLNH